MLQLTLSDKQGFSGHSGTRIESFKGLDLILDLENYGISLAMKVIIGQKNGLSLTVTSK